MTNFGASIPYTKFSDINTLQIFKVFLQTSKMCPWLSWHICTSFPDECCAQKGPLFSIQSSQPLIIKSSLTPSTSSQRRKNQALGQPSQSLKWTPCEHFTSLPTSIHYHPYSISITEIPHDLCFNGCPFYFFLALMMDRYCNKIDGAKIVTFKRQI